MKHRLTQRLAGLALSVALLAGCGAADEDRESTADFAGPPEPATMVDDGPGVGDPGDQSVVTPDMEMSDMAMSDAAMSDAAGDAANDAVTGAMAPVQSRAEGAALQPGEGEALQPIDIGRDIIYTAALQIEVDNVGPAASEALQTVERFGGLLFGQQTTTEGQGRTVLTFRVRPGDFQAVLGALGGIGELRAQSISTDDVTERVVDLQSQIVTAEASVERLRNFLDGAVGLDEVARLEEQLLTRETNLERLRGQLRTIQDHVDLATITLTIIERIPGPSIELAQTAYRGIDGGVSCPGETSVTVDEGDDLTLCLVMTNTGDTHLTDVRIVDDELQLDIADVVVVEGDLAGRLAPGDRLVAFYQAEGLDDDIELSAAVSAQVVDAEGVDLGVARVGRRGSGHVDVTPDDSPPGFADSLDAGVGVLALLGSLFVMVFGFVLPFVWVLPVLWLLRRFVGRRRPQPESSLPHPT